MADTEADAVIRGIIVRELRDAARTAYGVKRSWEREGSPYLAEGFRMKGGFYRRAADLLESDGRSPSESESWRPVSQSPVNYQKPWDCSPVLIKGASPATGEVRVYAARWSIPYEDAPPDRCSWTGWRGDVISTIVPAWITHWMPWPSDSEPA